MKKTIIILLITAISLLIIDLLTGFWYENKLNLLFSSNEFNNISTPIISFFAFIVYALALYMTIKQNKIILSQNIKPHYENEIEEYKIKAKGISIKNTFILDSIEYNGFEYIDAINDSLIQLTKDNDYNEDYEKNKKGEIQNKNYFKTRTYYDTLLFLSQFAIGLNPINLFHLELKTLIEEINTSKLINEDKSLLKKRIKRLFLDKYLTMMSLTQIYDFLKIPIPILYSTNKEIEFKTIAETEFGKHYEWFKNEI